MKNFHLDLRLLVAFIITSLIGCNNEIDVINKNSRCFSKFPKEETIVFENICEYKEGIAGTLTLVDSVLLILNEQPGANNFLNNYNLN